MGLVLGAMSLVPPLQRRISIPAMLFGGAGMVSLLIAMVSAAGSTAFGNTLILFHLLQLAAVAGMFAGGLGVRFGAAWARPTLYGAAVAWLAGNAYYAMLLAMPSLWFTLTGLTVAATVLGIPLLSTCAGMSCRLEEKP